MKKHTLVIIKYCLAPLVVVLLLFVGYVFYVLNTPMTLTNPPAVIDIAPGSSLKGVAEQLDDLGVVDSALIFNLYARVNNSGHRIKAGEYQFQRSQNEREVLGQLVKGEVVQHVFTIVEGWSFRQMMEAFSHLQKIEHKLKDLTDAEVMAQIGYPKVHPEGRFYPDTYYYTRGTSDIQLLRRAYQRMENVLRQEWQNRADELPYKSPYDALIMASIVEKETGLASERGQIAGVFVRRLQKGMRLQTDPTVIYGLGASYNGNIRRKHLKQPTPYNTYVIKGMPPTPIAMPGRDAIHAALHPEAGSSLYFVARGDGGHYFSTTLSEHSAAVKKYQLNPVQNYRSSPAKK